jgi:hypothetical protein
MSSSSQPPLLANSDTTKSESLSILMEARFYSPKISNLCYRLLDQLDQQGSLDLLALLEEVEGAARAAPGLLAPLVQQVIQAQQVQAVLLGQLEQLVLKALKEVKEVVALRETPDQLAEQAKQVLPVLLEHLGLQVQPETLVLQADRVSRESKETLDRLDLAVQQVRRVIRRP